MKRYVLCLTFLFVLTSCEFKSNERRKIEIMMSNPINLSLDKLKCIGHNLKKNDARYKWIVYKSLKGCKPCIISKVYDWEMFEHNCAEDGISVSFVCIFEQGDNEMDNILEAYKTANLSSNIYVDTANVFMTKNRQIPSERKYHTFLVDENNRVVLVGNPIYNEKISKMFFDIIRKK